MKITAATVGVSIFDFSRMSLWQRIRAAFLIVFKGRMKITHPSGSSGSIVMEES